MTRAKLLTLIAICAAPLTARAQDTPTPEEVARMCIQRMSRVAVRTFERMHVAADHGIAVIGELLAAEKPEEAAAAAQRAIGAVNQIAREGSGRIRVMLGECVAMLAESDASDELIAQVRQAAEGRLARIGQHRAAEVQRIEAALGG